MYIVTIRWTQNAFLSCLLRLTIDELLEITEKQNCILFIWTFTTLIRSNRVLDHFDLGLIVFARFCNLKIKQSLSDILRNDFSQQMGIGCNGEDIILCPFLTAISCHLHCFRIYGKKDLYIWFIANWKCFKFA